MWTVAQTSAHHLCCASGEHRVSCLRQIASIIKNVLLPACHENYSSDSLVPALQAASLWVLSRITEHIPSNLTMKCFSRSVELMSAADREKDDGEG